MILLDTNYLIRLLVPGTEEALRVLSWMRAGEILCTSAVSWYELVCGPVTAEEISLIEGLLRGGVLPLDRAAALEAGRLWNATGRVRSARVDSMVAGTAGAVEVDLATSNLRDFRRFEPLGIAVV